MRGWLRFDSIQSYEALMKSFALAASLLLMTTLLVGYGSGGAATQSFSGAVTYQGQPVQEGQIIFRGPNGEPDVAAIKDGKYSARTTLGQKKVEITAVKDSGKLDALGGKLMEQYLPSQYNENTTLTLDVTSSTTSHDFTLQ
jgi:hypothetical protein